MIEHYEILYIIPGDKTEEEAKPIVDQIHQLLKQREATIVKEDYWGKRKLAYPIDHQRQGFYDFVEFDLAADKMSELDNILRLNEDVLRHQIVRRIVKTPEQIAAREQLRERIAAKRQAVKEKEAVAAISSAASAAPPPPPAEPVKPVSGQELEKKLEEILESDKLDV